MHHASQTKGRRQNGPTQLLKAGTRVRLDATHGVVEVLSATQSCNSI